MPAMLRRSSRNSETHRLASRNSSTSPMHCGDSSRAACCKARHCGGATRSPETMIASLPLADPCRAAARDEFDLLQGRMPDGEKLSRFQLARNGMSKTSRPPRPSSAILCPTTTRQTSFESRCCRCARHSRLRSRWAGGKPRSASIPTVVIKLKAGRRALSDCRQRSDAFFVSRDDPFIRLRCHGDTILLRP